MVDSGVSRKIISYAVEANGALGASRDEITTGLSGPYALAFSGGRAYVGDRSLRKIISYAVGANGILGASRDEIASGLRSTALAFSGGRAYAADNGLNKIISYAVGANGILGAPRDEITSGLSNPIDLAFSGGRVYVANRAIDKIISYAVGANGILGASRDEITTGLSQPIAIAFSGGRAYVADFSRNKIISYAVEADGRLGASRDEITAGLSLPLALAFSGGRAYVGDFNLDKIISYPLFSSVAFAVAPDAPRVFAQSESEIEIAWNAVLGATHYKLYRSETSGGTFAQIGGDISITRYRDGNFPANTPYYYQLEACSGDECSGSSPEVSVTTAPTPSTPTAATQNNGAISIKWSAVAGATHYKLYRSETNDGSFMQIGGEITATDYVDSNLDANTSYYYRLEVCNDNGCSGRSPIGSAITTPATPATPTAAAQSDTEISIVWSEVAGATHYKLYRATVSGGTYMQIGGDIAATGYLDSGFSESTPYYYQLESCNGGECSGRSLEVSATTYATGSLGAGRDEITTGLLIPSAIAFSGGRAYVANIYPAKIISYPVGAGGELGAGRDEITTGLSDPTALAFSGGRAYVVERSLNKIISYPVGAGGELGAGRDEITTGLSAPNGLAFLGGRAYVTDRDLDKIISYPVGAGGVLGAGRDEITTDLSFPFAIAFSGGWAYVVDFDLAKIISYPVGAGGELGVGRDEITTDLISPDAIAFSGGRAYVAESERIISYPVGTNGRLSAGRDEVTGLLRYPLAIAFLGGRAYVTDELPEFLDKIISYPLFSSVAFAVVPDAPRAFAQSEGEIEIAWNAVLGATHYKLYRSATSGGLFTQVGGEISITRYQDDLSANIYYYYQLEACSGDECSERSPTARTAPDALRIATQNDSEIAIVWSAIAGATHYKLYRATVSGGAYTQIGGNIDALHYLDGNLSETTEYYYRLEVCNSGGCSGRSPEVSTTTYATGSLGAGRDEITTGLNSPRGIAFSGGRAYVVNRDSAKIVSYPVGVGGELGVERDEITTGLGSPYAIAFSGGRAYVTDFDLHKIISYPVGANGELGARRDEITNLNDPVAITFSGDRAYVVDIRVNKIISYAVGADGVLGAGRDEITGGLNSPRALAFAGGRVYVADFDLDKIISYPVDAEGRLGEGREEITSGLAFPLALAFLGDRAYVGDGDLDKIISYPVDADGELGEGREEITAGLDLPIVLAFSGDRVYVADGTLDKIISYPLFSSVAFAVAPDAPRVFTQSESEIEIAWNAVLGATHYKLYRSETSGGTYTQVGGDITITRYQDSRLSVNASYYYQLESCNGDECSGRLPEVSTTTAPPIPSAPMAAAQSDSEISITWSAVAGATHYKLYRSTTSGGSYARIGGDIVATRYRNSGLSANISYYYRLESCNSGGCSKPSSEVSATTTGPLGEGRDEITVGLDNPSAIAFSGGRAYVAASVYDSNRDRFIGKIISYPVGSDGILGAERDEITTGLSQPSAIAFSGGRAYVTDFGFDKIISYAVGADGRLGAGRDEITFDLSRLIAIAFSGGRAYVVDILGNEDKIISYAVGADGRLGAGRDEITPGLDNPLALAFSGGRAYVGHGSSYSSGKIISYAVGVGRKIGRGARRDNDWFASTHRVFGRACLCGGGPRLHHLLCGGSGRKFGRGAQRDNVWFESNPTRHRVFRRSGLCGGFRPQ